ncbi:MAG: tetratricopeptide repeat protein [Meiothermus sp.]|uniref:tetratricopeptide repeat protein n=1 Tax=Meiothermus sp. TaxID=1955249 RepID=UPI0025F98958|nr:tetratricopeptide repeat protein [Meiothermus sp.]MCS7057263.1 tetratricopeptide repeat protein [Meiothermus sp.]MCS7193631.1 tetratricopeptide repeat protein [Meiothermus sp.]MDW8091430.1 tetratricopeptide repeat protein [Meiothermus sp.]MDW8481898.1 tetratricopeptide repeat protein [Meiothermus sp.]
MEGLGELIRSGHYDEARRRLLLGEEGDADGLAALLELRDWLRLKEYREARRVLRQEADLLGAYLDPARVEEALEAFEAEQEARIRPYTEDPHLGAEAWTTLGLIWVRTGRREEAHRAFEEALQRDPGHFRAKTNLANLALEAGETDRAIALYQEVLKQHPDYPLAHHNLGAAYRKKGQFDKAVYHLKRGQRLQMQPPTRPPRPPVPGSVGLPERRPWLGGWTRRWWLWLGVGVLLYWWLGRSP